MGTIITAVIILGFIALVIWLLAYVNKRDMKKEAARQAGKTDEDVPGPDEKK